MPVLHLGVVDIPYSQAPSAGQRKVKAATVTTGDVAEWLETRYHVMEVFFRQHAQEVAGDLEHSLAGALEDLLLGAPPGADAFGTAMAKVHDRFQAFIDLKEMDALGYPGVPTQASLRGVRHRFKHPYKRRAPRPSFQDTGLYETSFTSWVD